MEWKKSNYHSSHVSKKKNIFLICYFFAQEKNLECKFLFFPKQVWNEIRFPFVKKLIAAIFEFCSKFSSSFKFSSGDASVSKWSKFSRMDHLSFPSFNFLFNRMHNIVRVVQLWPELNKATNSGLNLLKFWKAQKVYISGSAPNAQPQRYKRSSLRFIALNL